MTDSVRFELNKNFATQLDNVFLENQKAFDKAILTLSSWGIGALLAYAQASKVNSKALLILSVGPFFISIILIVFSFLFAQKLINQKKENANEYYIKHNESCANTEFSLEKNLIRIHWFAAIAFLTSILFSIIFIIKNN